MHCSFMLQLNENDYSKKTYSILPYSLLSSASHIQWEQQLCKKREKSTCRQSFLRILNFETLGLLTSTNINKYTTPRLIDKRSCVYLVSFGIGGRQVRIRAVTQLASCGRNRPFAAMLNGLNTGHTT